MKTLRQALAAALALVVAVPSSFAGSLYSGAAETPVAPSGAPTNIAPRLPLSPAMGFDLGASMMPGTLAPTAIPAMPQSQAVGAKADGAKAPAAAIPTAAGVTLSAAKAVAPKAEAPKTALQQVQGTAERVSASAGNGNGNNGNGAAPQAALNDLFDGLQNGSNNGTPPSGPATAQQDADGVEAFIAKASRLFHPALQGEAPAVAARTQQDSGIAGAIPSDSDMQARMQLSPLTNPEREAAVISLYQGGGAAAQVVDVARGQAPRFDLYDTIQRQDAGKGRHNLIVVKKGKSDRVIVVGGHHDKVSEGAGTIDNWTGATMVTNLYQAMKGVDTDATYVFVAFAREEEGLLGSEAFVQSLPAAQKARIDSMINLDTLGVDGTFSWKNNSTRSLLDLIQRVATKEKYDLIESYLNGGDADSSTFRQAGIAAMTIFGASQEVIFDIIHTAADQMAAFSLPHYRNAYLLTLALLKALDHNPVKKAGAV
jgi:hypothetical protein